MKLLFINLHYETDIKQMTEPVQEIVYLPSLTLMQLAALTPEKHNIDFSDNPNNIDFNENYDLIGISTVTPSALDSYQIADKFRRMRKTVVLGGYHVSALPEEAKQHADAVVIGEAEETWPQLLKDFEMGKLKPFYKQTRLVDPKLIPAPKRECFNKNVKVAPVQISRGCPIGCKFCAITNSKFGNHYRTRPIKNVIREIESIPQDFLFFCDASLTINLEYTKQLFRKMKKLDKRLLACNGNVNVLSKDKELLKLSSDAGCLQWHTGFESIFQKNLNEMGKTTNKIDDYSLAVKKIHDYGMDVIGEFVIGFDRDTPEVFNLTREFVRKLNIEAAGFNILVPYPGSPLFRRLDKENRILTKKWSKYTCRNVVFKPKYLSEKMLLEETFKLNEEFFLKNISNLVTKWIKNFST